MSIDVESTDRPFSSAEITEVRRAVLKYGTEVDCPCCDTRLQSIHPLRVSETGAVVWHARCATCERGIGVRAIPPGRARPPDFAELVASRPGRHRWALVPRWAAMAGVHGVIIYLAVLGTRPEVIAATSAPPDTNLVILAAQRPEATPPPPVIETVALPTLPKGFQSIHVTTVVPTTLPPVNLSERFDPRDYSGIGVEGGAFEGLGGGEPPNRGSAFSIANVDEPPELLSSPPLRYPELLRSAGLEGVVVVGFVVDSTGSADPQTIRVVASSNEGFERSATDLVRRSRYRPARVRGVAVRVLATLRIEFNLTSARQH